MMIDTDGLERYDMEWMIEGKPEANLTDSKGIRSGRLYEMHAAELENAKRMVRATARRGDTVTIKVI